MSYILFSSVLTLLGLTITFSFSSLIASLIRARVLRGHEELTCKVWAIVLVLSLVPVNIGFLLPSDSRLTTAIASAISDQITKISNTAGSQNTANAFNAESALKSGDSIELVPIKHTEQQHILDPTPYICGGLMLVWFSVAVVKLSLSLREYVIGKRKLEFYSIPLEYGRTRKIFEQCLEMMDKKSRFSRFRSTKLMLVAGGKVCSPCVCGIFSPRIYIDEATAAMPEEKLRYIFIHELTHIKQRHLPLKLLANIAAAVHWFNPIAKRCTISITHDCELACDRGVVRCFGEDTGDDYMYTILETARRICAVKAYAGVKALGGGLFLSENSEKRFLEKRYVNMKQKATFRHPRLAVAAALAACILFGGVVMASCGIPERLAGGGISTGSPLLDEGIRAYYGLENSDPITKEMLEGIKTIELLPSTIIENYIAKVKGDELPAELTEKLAQGVFVEYIINGTVIDVVESKPSVARFEGTIDAVVKTYSEKNETDESRSIHKKWNAFYTKKDPSDPDLSDEDREEIIATYPESVERPFYMLDPYATERELGHLLVIALNSGLLDSRYIGGGMFDAGPLASLPNLESVKFTRITPVNYDESLAVIVDESAPLE